MGLPLPKKVEIRETRLHTILTYNGDSKDLGKSSKDNKLKIGNFKFSQCGNCQADYPSEPFYKDMWTFFISQHLAQRKEQNEFAPFAELAFYAQFCIVVFCAVLYD